MKNRIESAEFLGGSERIRETNVLGNTELFLVPLDRENLIHASAIESVVLASGQGGPSDNTPQASTNRKKRGILTSSLIATGGAIINVLGSSVLLAIPLAFTLRAGVGAPLLSFLTEHPVLIMGSLAGGIFLFSWVKEYLKARRGC